MSQRTRQTTFCLAGVAAALSLAGCGSGGNDSAPATPAPTVALTAGNQDAAARAAANAALGSAEIADLAPASAGASAIASAAKPHALSVSRSLPQLLLGLTREMVIDRAVAKAAAMATGGAVRAQALISATENCAVSGTVTLSLDDRDNNNAVSAGDVVSITFAQCRPSATELVDGGISATYTIVSQTGSLASATASVTYSQLTATSGDQSFSINGGFSFNFSVLNSVSTAQLAIGGSGLTASVATPGYSDTITLGAGYNVTATYDSAALPPGSSIAGLATLTVNGAITAASIGGTIVISTPITFRRYAIDPHPREGQLQVRGVNNGLLVVTVLSTTTVRLQLDANGDGTFEATRDVAWDDLV
jgi:hypothetical protein